MRNIIPPRHPVVALKENEKVYTDLYDKAIARMSDEEGLYKKFEAQLDKAVAAGEPGLIDQIAVNYMTEEALVRSFPMQFGEVVLEGRADQVPEFTYLTPASIDYFTVAVTAGKARARRRRVYTVGESQSTGSWKEIQSEPVEIPFVNPFFKRKRAILETQAAEKLAYFLQQELDGIAWTSVTGAIGAFGSATIWTFQDSNVVGLPTTNTYTSAKGFWPTLREKVIPHFQGANLANNVINIHIRHTDLQFLYQVAGIGTQSLGAYTDHQQKVYDGNITDINIYGHRFRIIPQNSRLTSGTLYATVGPVFKMWLPPEGNVVDVNQRRDGSQERFVSRIYEILQPSIWRPRVMYTTWSTSDTSA